MKIEKVRVLLLVIQSLLYFASWDKPQLGGNSPTNVDAFPWLEPKM